MMALILTLGFATDPNEIGQGIGTIRESRTVGYAEHGASGMLTLLVRTVLCNWMVCTGVVAVMMSTSVTGKVAAMWMPIMLFYLAPEYAVVNMFLFPTGLMLGGDYTISDYFLWNQLPALAGNVVDDLTFVGLTLYATHVRAGPSRPRPPSAEFATVEHVDQNGQRERVPG